ncbi:unnamed protein product [Heterobilharzia americana]|nr:unnamed protein product [Heterobilharzia americana]
MVSIFRYITGLTLIITTFSVVNSAGIFDFSGSNFKRTTTIVYHFPGSEVKVYPLKLSIHPRGNGLRNNCSLWNIICITTIVIFLFSFCFT